MSQLQCDNCGATDHWGADCPHLHDVQRVGEYHPENINLQQFAAEIVTYRTNILYYIKTMWGFIPQEPKPEYQERWEEVLRATGPTWLRLKDDVTAEWFGEPHEAEYGTTHWTWYGFRKGTHITWQQCLVLLAFQKSIEDKRVPRNVTIRSGHGIGKSATVSWIVLWFLHCFAEAQVPVTAPTAPQMHDVLWKEMAIWISRMPEEVAELFDWQNGYIRMKYSPETWFARARTSTKENTEAIAGVHSDSVLIAADEASGVPDQIYNAAEGALTSGNVYVILISNPTRTMGYFYDTHHKMAADWQCFAFDCQQSPVVDEGYVQRQAKRHGVHSDEFGIRVLGKFPSEDAMDDSGYLQLIPRSRIEVKPTVPNEIWFRPVLAIDPSGEGDDECEFFMRDRFKAKNVLSLTTTNDKEIAEYIIKFAETYNLKTGDIVIEGFGVGASAARHVAADTKGRLQVYVVLPGNAPQYEEKLNGEYFRRFAKEMDDKNLDLFQNLRAVGHFRMRWWLIGGGYLCDNNTESSETLEQIIVNKYKRVGQGNKIQMMPKKEMQKLRIPSPNKSDALMLSFLLEREERTQSPEEAAAIRSEQTTIDDPFAVL